MKALPAIFLILAAFPAKGKTMNPKVTRAGGFDVIGIAVRTTNKAEMGPGGKIPGMWQKVLSGALNKIQNKSAANEIIALYYDYESDKDGEYSYLIGVRVNADAAAPEGMIRKHVPEGKYAVFTTEKGPPPQVVPAAWKHIWELKKDQPGGDRAYTVDYEVYDERTADPSKAEVDIYIAIR